MAVLVTIQDATGLEVWSFEAEDQKSLIEMAAMHGIEILHSCGTGYCGVCLCDVVEWAEGVDLNKMGDHLLELPTDDEGNPKQILACVGGVQSSRFNDGQEHRLVIKKVY